MIRDLMFRVPEFKQGRNTTVRRGIKWDLTDMANISTIGVVSITTKVVRFSDILPEDVVDNHDPFCREYSGLSTRMKQVYPGFDESEIVTVVEFNNA